MSSNNFNAYLDSHDVSGEKRGQLSAELSRLATRAEMDKSTLGDIVALAAYMVEAGTAQTSAEQSTDRVADK